MNYRGLTQLPLALTVFLIILLVLSLGLYVMCRWRLWSRIVAVVFTVSWVVFMLPDTQYYLDTRHATADSIVEPFYRSEEIIGYFIALFPLPFIACALWLRGKRPI